MTFETIEASTQAADLLSVSGLRVISALKRTGAVLFRGFALDADRLKTFTQSYSREILVHPNSRRVPLTKDKQIVMVDANEEAIPAHSELTYLPGRPELQWFWCQQPAAAGGETTLCDGAKVWKQLSPKTREVFLRRRIEWSFPEPLWPWLWSQLFTVRNIDELNAKLSVADGVIYSFDQMHCLRFAFRVSAVTRALHVAEPVFANNLLTGGIDLRFEDGEALPALLLDEVLGVTASLEERVAWRTSDVLMIDNSRFMHGRRAFKGNERRVAAMISNAAF